MGPLTRSGSAVLLATLLVFAVCATYAQTLPASGHCDAFAVPTQVRAEGHSERVGDIILQCSGSNPGAVFSGNLTIFLPVSVTNRVDSNNLTRDAVLSADLGSGFVATAVAGLVTNLTIAFNGIDITAPASGNFSLRVSNIRADVFPLGPASLPVRALISLSSPAIVPLNQQQLIVAVPQASLFTALASANVTCSGSPLPATLNLANLFATRTAFASTRVTEGFGAAFEPRSADADTGTRFLIKYTGFPANSRLFVPDFVAGSDALTPTAGGDLAVRQSPGQYVPGSGTLLLVRVAGADAAGAGGLLLPAPTGSGPVTLGSVSEVALANGGSGYAVYEVADSNPVRIESAQFPTFLGLSNVTAPALTDETISLAPVSNIAVASTSAPIPRFAPVTPSSDCNILGDCQAGYFPKLSADSTPIQLTAVAGGPMTSKPGQVFLRNVGGGILNWSVSVNYTNGSGWLSLDTSSGVESGGVRVSANPQGLAAGTYRANLVVDGGPAAGTLTIPVTLTVEAAPPASTSSTSGPAPAPTPAPTLTATVKPSVTAVVNAATFEATPLVPGSLATLMGANLAGKTVSVTFDGSAANLLYTGTTQINLQVPEELASKASATMVVTVDGASSAPQAVVLSPAWPAVFAHGVLNQDNSENTSAAAANAGSILQIFATGIPAGASVTARIADREGLVPLYAGPAPAVPGVQQVNVAVPDGLSSMTAQLLICAATGSRQYCSAGYPLAIQ